MYFADPSRGKRRRAIARDGAAARWRDVAHEIDKAARDLSNRTQGLNAGVQSVFRRPGADGPLLEARIRSRIGRVVSHPHAIRVGIEPDGRVLLHGDILTHEAPYLVKTVSSVPGVKQIVNHLDAHDEPGGIASLQGGAGRRHYSEFAQENWTPVLRISAGALAGLGFYAALRNEGPVRWAAALGGTALLARAVSNRSFTGVFGFGDGGVVDIDKTIHILAPVREVFDFWSKVENFPRFMSHLKEVRDLGNNRSHWVAAGPGGIAVPWDAEITSSEPHRLLAWKSVPGSLVRTAGRIRFEEDSTGGTRVTIRMSYCPPAGIFGHTVAWLFGADPKSEIDDDMVRLKSLLEIGKTRAHGETVWREQVVEQPVG